MKITVIKITNTVLLFALLGLGIYYFLTQTLSKTISKDDAQEVQSKIENESIYTNENKSESYDEYVERPDEVSYPINLVANGGAYANEQYSFDYPIGWYLYDNKVKDFLILLKTEKLMHVASEIYALGQQIIIDNYETHESYSSAMEYLDKNVFSQKNEDGYEGAPTSVQKENINGREAFRVEHTSQIPTLYYYFVDGRTIYTIKLYPYIKDNPGKNYDDFMKIVNSFFIK